MYKYLSRVRFIDGFYKGRLGRVIEVSEDGLTVSVRIRSGLLLGRYIVKVPASALKKRWVF